MTIAKAIMINLAFVGLILVPSVRSMEKQPPGKEEGDLKDTLTRLETASWEAWQKRDGSFFETFLSNDHVEVGFGGRTGKATVVVGVASPSCVVKRFDIDRFALTLFDSSTALLTYHASQDTTCRGTAVPSPVWVSSLYIKRDGRWQNALYQQTQTAK